MDLEISKVGSQHVVTIEGNTIPNVIDYKISSSMHGDIELEVKIKVTGEIMEFATSTTTELY